MKIYIDFDGVIINSEKLLFDNNFFEQEKKRNA